MTVIQLNTSSAPNPAVDLPDVLRIAKDEAQAEGLAYAGIVAPDDAWKLFINGQAHLVDVRAAEERKFVGHVPNTLHVAWQTGPALIKNPRFVRELENKLPKDAVILLLCRSGKRSAAAAANATTAGFKNVFNVREGFEGDLDDRQQRGTNGGWRQRGLPWVQD
ncbi:rhodanese-like domain-containing protein [Cellvibrio fibrivorans]|uniref:Rhodanese-related sulfurtransferase n=1 Tax=Cellvibrio fibrivorans TaxID=126350 RepID=A0ABU1UY97_9GAMM|nr:rhodanese-like domain-containing protein [Cellvibrio fibrivorans]MDR7090073.1 rhodanese-related sulfurtransferase [Cellvibrio fibrivorans]